MKSHQNPGSVLQVLTHPAVYIYFIVPLLFLVIFAVMLGRFSFQNVDYSAADLMINLLTTRIASTLFVFLWTILTMVLLLRDFDSACIIRHRSRRELWLKQVQKTTLLCGVYALFLTVALAAVGRLVCETSINFASKESYFFLVTGKVMPENPASWLMLFVFFTTLLLPMIAMCLLVLLSKWVLNNPVFGIIGVIAVAVSGWFSLAGDKVLLVYPYRFPGYEKWLNIPGFFLELLIPLLWIVGLVGVGLIVSQRRDFLNVHQK